MLPGCQKSASVLLPGFQVLTCLGGKATIASGSPPPTPAIPEREWEGPRSVLTVPPLVHWGELRLRKLLKGPTATANPETLIGTVEEKGLHRPPQRR